MARYEETFNQADSTTVGPALTWTQVVGTWDTLTQRLRLTTAPGGSLSLYIRAEHDTSTSDMSTEVTCDITGSGNDGGPGVRCSSSAATMYYTYVNDQGFQFISKAVAGVQTDLSNVAVSVTSPAVLRIEVFGSTLRSYYNGLLTNTITDSSITTGTRAGIKAYSGSTNTIFFTKFTTQDFAPPTYDRRLERFPGYRPPLGKLFNRKIPRPQFLYATSGISRDLAANNPTALSAKATVGVNKGVSAKAATATSAKATLSVARKVAAKSATSSSSKATARVAKALIAKAATSLSAKATRFNATRPLTAKSPTATSAKASLTNSSAVVAPPATPAQQGGSGPNFLRGPSYPDRTPEQVLREEEEIMVLL